MHARLIAHRHQHSHSLVENVTSIPRPRLDLSWCGFYFAYYFAGPTRALHAQSAPVS